VAKFVVGDFVLNKDDGASGWVIAVFMFAGNEWIVIADDRRDEEAEKRVEMSAIYQLSSLERDVKYQKPSEVASCPND
jgi:hypothetical protein